MYTLSKAELIWETLLNSILHVEALNYTAEVQNIVYALQEIHLVVGKYLFLLQDPIFFFI
jgi:hypothetical protein